MRSRILVAELASFVGWIRRLGRRLRTGKGALLTLFVGILLSLWFVLFLVTALMQSPCGTRGYTRACTHLRAAGAFGLLRAPLGASLERADDCVYAGRSESLVPAPFSRRQLLGYKMVVLALKSIAGTLIFSILFMQYAHHFLAAYIGRHANRHVCAACHDGASLVAATGGALAYRRGRRWLLAMVVAAVAVAAVLFRGKFQADRSGWVLVDSGVIPVAGDMDDY